MNDILPYTSSFCCESNPNLEFACHEHLLGLLRSRQALHTSSPLQHKALEGWKSVSQSLRMVYWLDETYRLV